MADYEAVHKVQAGYKVTPLSQQGKTVTLPPVKIDPTVDMKTPPKIQVDTMSAAEYFAYAAELLKVNPPHATDQPIIARMKDVRTALELLIRHLSLHDEGGNVSLTSNGLTTALAYKSIRPKNPVADQIYDLSIAGDLHATDTRLATCKQLLQRHPDAQQWLQAETLGVVCRPTWRRYLRYACAVEGLL